MAQIVCPPGVEWLQNPISNTPPAILQIHEMEALDRCTFSDDYRDRESFSKPSEDVLNRSPF